MRSNQPLIADIIVGLIGAVIGGLVLGLLGIGTPEGGIGGMIANFVVATIGAVILLAILGAVRGRRV